MKTNKKHTFVVCAYQESPYLDECIRSLLSQTKKSKIIIVTSTPNTYIKSTAEKYKLELYINNGTGGITQDWNFGYSCADSDYITIAHQDDVYDENYLETALRCLDRSKHPLIFFSDYYEIREGEKVSRNSLLLVKRIMLFPLRAGFTHGSRWVRRRILSFGSPICCPAVTFCRNNLPPVIFLNHYRACEDWEAWESISRLKGDFLYSPNRLMGHRIHNDSETSSSIQDHVRTNEEFEMFCKFWPEWIARILSGFYAKGQNSNQL